MTVVSVGPFLGSVIPKHPSSCIQASPVGPKVREQSPEENSQVLYLDFRLRVLAQEF